jgi:putative PIN family toxin of toxin-antitoxin system
MIKAVVDTNVFASGVFWRGAPYQVFEAWMAGKFRWVVSAEIIDEYDRVLHELAGTRPGFDVTRLLEVVSLGAEMVSPAKLGKPVCSDPDDDKFIETAVSAGAEFIVSGDKALLAVKRYGQVRVVNAPTFLKAM